MSVPGPVLGPCESWISGDDVAACCDTGVGTDTSLLDMVAVEASMVLYELSGRKFNGGCTMTVRPCVQNGCGCWPRTGVWRWGGIAWWGYGDGSSPSNYDWQDEGCLLNCGCAPVSRVKLAGYPVTEITEVLIDDEVVDPAGYRLDKRRELVRLDDPGPPVVKRRWPGCQNISLESGHGTFFVTYRSGVAPPPVGMRAAAELACQLWLSCPGNGSDGDCVLPEGVTRIDRQGITIDRQILAGFFDPTKPTGLFSLDLFITGYCHGRIGYRRPAVWSPDIGSFPLRVG